MTFEDDLRTLVRARYPIIWVTTHEEERVLRAVAAVARKPKGDAAADPKAMFLWSQSRALESVNVKTLERNYEDGDREMVDSVAFLESVIQWARAETEAETGEGRIYVARDLHRFFSADNPTYRFLRDSANAMRNSRTTLIVTSPVSSLPIECEKDVVVVDLPLPTAAELRVRLNEILQMLTVPAPKNGEAEKVVKAGLGLTEDEFASAVKESAVRTGHIDPAVIVRQKEQVIRKSGVVQLYQTTETLDDVGGLDFLRAWVKLRALTFSDKAAAFGLRSTKGMFLTGPPGTGKSLFAKAVSGFLGFPLLWLKGGAVFSKYVGESEQNLDRVLKLADAVSPCVLFIDECEKLLGSAAAGASNDGGVSQRVFGSLLTWMAEHTSPVLVVATANNPLAIPPEMLSRFDATFFVDLPQATERLAIARIHLKKVHRDPKMVDALPTLAAATEGFSGREIERAVQEGLNRAFQEKRELGVADLLAGVKSILPVSRTRKDAIEEMRRWAAANAVPASEFERPVAKKGKVDL
jgi:SpoVK/Ycf46/Vps4 family AAA+-type ATPase